MSKAPGVKSIYYELVNSIKDGSPYVLSIESTDGMISAVTTKPSAPFESSDAVYMKVSRKTVARSLAYATMKSVTLSPVCFAASGPVATMTALRVLKDFKTDLCVWYTKEGDESPAVLHFWVPKSV